MPSKFDFISPEIQVREIDESQVPAVTSDEGVLIIGQAIAGPALKQVKVNNLDELYTVFGKPQSGKTNTTDIWRAGNVKLPTYGLYAAEAWLASETSPVTFVRLLGEDQVASKQEGGTYVDAGWNLSHTLGSTISSVKTAYGLFVAPSASSGTTNGTLAAIVYTNGAALALSGTIFGSSDTTASAGTFIMSAGSDNLFKLEVHTDGSTSTSYEFHFNPTSKDKFIRNVLNCNPQKIESINQANTESYFLGESFETDMKEIVNDTSSSAGKHIGILLPLASGSAYWVNQNRPATAAKTGWVINRDAGAYASYDKTNHDKLFRLCSLHEGEWFQKNFSVVVQDLKLGTTISPDSTFSVVIERGGVVVEKFTGCNLNENSENFVAKKIGDQYLSWNSTAEKYNLIGSYQNNSNYVRVEMANDWKAGISDAYMLPFGFFGPAKPKAFSISSGSANLFSNSAHAFVVKADDGTVALGHDKSIFADYAIDVTASLTFPEIRLTETSTRNGNDYRYNDVFGARHARDNSSNVLGIYGADEKDYLDIVRALPASLDIHAANDTTTETSFIFTLDEIRETSAGYYYWEDGSRLAGNSITANSGSENLIVTQKVKQFRMPFFGGFDGVDITLTDPFSSRASGPLADQDETKHYAYYSIKRVLDVVKDEELAQYDVISMPGIWDADLQRELINNTEERGDALAIVDLDGGFLAAHENNGTEDLPTAVSAVSNANTRNYNTSYAATYYPPVRLDNGLIVHSSVAGIGVLAQSDKASGAPWFAPAGFNRGGLSQLGGSQGPRVVAAVENLNKADRDDLYEVNVNPIANFPGVQGPVVFGQKTLQQTPSALDRINVRRLMIYLKKRVGAVARDILFDNNVRATWNRFKARADSILRDAQSRFGITEYKLVLDETTTTPDLIDRNILYAKVFIKPARAIEFIAIDFTITRSGIEF
jgi:hypothetical protein